MSITAGFRSEYYPPPVIVTQFFDKFASKKREATFDVDELAKLIKTTTQRTKETLPWLKLARFGENKTDKGSFRHDDNLLAITGIEADYDGEKVSFDDAVETLTKAGIRAIAYTSPSHRAGKPRWRVFCPCPRNIPPRSATSF